VYHAFNKAENFKTVMFNGMRSLSWTLDFNVNPMCMLLMQRVDEMVYILEEIIIKPCANTEAACEAFFQRAMVYLPQVDAYQRPLTVKIYGDASGHQQRTSGSQTDWAIIKQFFEKWLGTLAPEFHTAASNPAIRDRINCVNSRSATI